MLLGLLMLFQSPCSNVHSCDSVGPVRSDPSAENVDPKHELSNLADLIVERKKENEIPINFIVRQPTIEEAFRAAFEAGIASDLDVEKPGKNFRKRNGDRNSSG